MKKYSKKNVFVFCCIPVFYFILVNTVGEKLYFSLFERGPIEINIFKFGIGLCPTLIFIFIAFNSYKQYVNIKSMSVDSTYKNLTENEKFWAGKKSLIVSFFGYFLTNLLLAASCIFYAIWNFTKKGEALSFNSMLGLSFLFINSILSVIGVWRSSKNGNPLSFLKKSLWFLSAILFIFVWAIFPYFYIFMSL